MKRLLKIVPVLALALVGCRETGKGGEYFVLDGKIFVFNYRVARATYLVNLKPVRPVEEGQVAVASFEDPAGGAPIVVREKIFAINPKTTINSPPVFCIVKDKPYAVSIKIEDASGAVLQTISTTVTSNESEAEVMPDQPLVVGPFYSPNDGSAPVAAGRPDHCPPTGS